jgi:hypothetical protein
LPTVTICVVGVEELEVAEAVGELLPAEVAALADGIIATRFANRNAVRTFGRLKLRHDGIVYGARRSGYTL